MKIIFATDSVTRYATIALDPENEAEEFQVRALLNRVQASGAKHFLVNGHVLGLYVPLKDHDEPIPSRPR